MSMTSRFAGLCGAGMVLFSALAPLAYAQGQGARIPYYQLRQSTISLDDKYDITAHGQCALRVMGLTTDDIVWTGKYISRDYLLFDLKEGRGKKRGIDAVLMNVGGSLVEKVQEEADEQDATTMLDDKAYNISHVVFYRKRGIDYDTVSESGFLRNVRGNNYIFVIEPADEDPRRKEFYAFDFGGGKYLTSPHDIPEPEGREGQRMPIPNAMPVDANTRAMLEEVVSCMTLG